MTQLPTPEAASPSSGSAASAGALAAALAAAGVIRLGPALIRFTGRDDGDMGDPTGTDPDVDARRRSVVDHPGTWVHQVHGSAVVVVEAPGDGTGRFADAAVTAVTGAALAIVTADCAPVAFASPEGVIGVAHAGWRGLVAGVIEETVVAMRQLGASSVWAVLGPCIHAECYAFGHDDLDVVASRLGPDVRSETSTGQPALDIPRAVLMALGRAGAELVGDVGVCTSCSTGHWSWRARQDSERQATVVWLP